jgi:HEPN domain-containing protein
MNEFTEHALKLLRKSSEDLYAARCLDRDPGVSVWTVGFHAQQSVEKALKAVLMGRGVPYPFTHDIKALVNLARQSALPLPPGEDDLPYLTPFGTLFRYEDQEEKLPRSVNMAQLLEWAETTLDWAKSILSLGIE